jgi:hypothetical protein
MNVTASSPRPNQEGIPVKTVGDSALFTYTKGVVKLSESSEIEMGAAPNWVKCLALN